MAGNRLDNKVSKHFTVFRFFEESFNVFFLVCR